MLAKCIYFFWLLTIEMFCNSKYKLLASVLDEELLTIEMFCNSEYNLLASVLDEDDFWNTKRACANCSCKIYKKMYINIVYIIHIILFFINTVLFCEPTDLDQDSGPGGGVSVWGWTSTRWWPRILDSDEGWQEKENMWRVLWHSTNRWPWRANSCKIHTERNHQIHTSGRHLYFYICWQFFMQWRSDLNKKCSILTFKRVNRYTGNIKVFLW